ncbi:hypothetical protein BJY59DRAFT_705026 [Rhodotorula toruloides]
MLAHTTLRSAAIPRASLANPRLAVSPFIPTWTPYSLFQAQTRSCRLRSLVLTPSLTHAAHLRPAKRPRRAGADQPGARPVPHALLHRRSARHPCWRVLQRCLCYAPYTRREEHAGRHAPQGALPTPTPFDAFTAELIFPFLARRRRTPRWLLESAKTRRTSLTRLAET